MKTIGTRSIASVIIMLLNVASGLMILGLILTAAVMVFAPMARGVMEVDATWLGVGTRTVEQHRRGAFAKLGVATRAELVRIVLAAGLLAPDAAT